MSDFIDLSAISEARWREITDWHERECDPRNAVIIARHHRTADQVRNDAFWRAVEQRPEPRLRRVTPIRCGKIVGAFQC
jgi:hypothetical protein